MGEVNMNKLSKLILATGFSTFMLATSAIPALAASAANNYCNTTALGGVVCANATAGGVIQVVVNTIIFIGLALALIFLIYGGVKWIMSGGDKAQTETAKNAVTSALIGLAVVLGAYILINVVLNFFQVEGGLRGLGGAITPSALEAR
jgi:hypothetical protein